MYEIFYWLGERAAAATVWFLARPAAVRWVVTVVVVLGVVAYIDWCNRKDRGGV